MASSDGLPLRSVPRFNPESDYHANMLVDGVLALVNWPSSYSFCSIRR